MAHSEATYEFVLTDMTIFSSRNETELEMVLGPADSDRSKELMDRIDRLAKASEGKRTEEIIRECKNTIGLQEENIKYLPQEVDQFITVVTYVFASSGALVIFARNVLGLAKDWRDLSKGRSLKAREKGKEIEINEVID